ncbi:ABC transporter permease [Corynebacterium yudongzhengii]|uniref:ABC transporter permease n=1 Tax=Corynebacterium yudongzhengii TaxID=2080740 RepID=A0A2U1T8T1_9CORY|nr:ABC transporter permease [Corynebacterium yudongzhengii]AWB82520.1 ABC transporter permease [Corynebacterium yudongzhengii]PWC02424.1 ABC transporter permease [Corynebacterium yudongzhengii]
MTTAHVLRRIGQALIVIWATFTLAFILLTVLPSDAVAARYADPVLGLTDAQLEEIRAVYGADESALSRYFAALGGFLTGDLGYSVASGTAVTDLLAETLPATLTLAATAFLLGVAMAFVIAVCGNFGPVRSFFQALPPLMVSLPTFWVGTILIQLFSFQLGLVPVIGGNNAENLILPAITLAITVAAPLAQVLLRSIDEVLGQPFITAVRARGASDWWILSRNVLRNALLPALTMAGILFGELVGGSVVTEAVFGRTGIGSITVDAVTDRDTAVLLAVVVIAAAVFVLINLIVDLLYPVLDTRLRKKATR